MFGGPPSRLRRYGATDFACVTGLACLDEARAVRRERSLAGSTGLEPAASGVTGRRSNQLNYDPKELTIPRKKDEGLPSSFFLRPFLMGGTGLEPVTPGV